MSDRLRRLRRALGQLLWPEPASAQEMAEDHRTSNLVLAFVMACMGITLWSWDWAHDPLGAPRTLWLRLAILPAVLPYALALWRRAPLWAASALGWVAVLGWEIGFLLILGRLEHGMAVGLAGFMYFLMMPLVMMRGLSLAGNLALLVTVVVVPLVSSRAGWTGRLDDARYLTLLGPAAIMNAMALGLAAAQHRRVRQLRGIIEASARTDALTGLANRRAFDERLRQEAQRSARYGPAPALLLADLDHFKRVNDTYGHPVGDLVLRAVADRCRQAVRDADLVARVGGEEFAILLVAAGDEQLRQVAERVRGLVAGEPVEVGGGVRLRCTISVGGAVLDGEVDELVAAADRALYAAKDLGRNRCCFALTAAAALEVDELRPATA